MRRYKSAEAVERPKLPRVSFNLYFFEQPHLGRYIGIIDLGGEDVQQ